MTSRCHSKLKLPETERDRLLRFVIVGAFCALVNILARVVFDLVTSFQIAVLLAFGVALTTAFTLNRSYVFAPSGRGLLGEYGRFALINVVALGQVWIISVGLARVVFPALGYVWYPELVAHSIGVVSPVVTSYFAHKHFSFRRASD